MDFAFQSLKQADHFLEESEILIDQNIKDMAFIALYNACFHSARALLFKDGIKERSHYCVSKYIEKNYAEKELVSFRQAVILDALREKRNGIQYSLEPISFEENLHEVFNEVQIFIEKCKTLINCIN